MNIFKLFVFAVVSMCSSVCCYAANNLHTIETDHARIHFTCEYQAMAQMIANKFEPTL